MKFAELSPENQSCAAQALASILTNCGAVTEADVKQFGEFVATAFIAMETFDSTPGENRKR